MAISFPLQINGMTADATYINAIAEAVEDHDAALEAMGADVHGVGKIVGISGDKAVSDSNTPVAIEDYVLPNLTIPAGRIVEFVARLAINSSSTSPAVAMIRLRQNSVDGPGIGEQPIYMPVMNYDMPATIVFPWRSTGETITWLLTLARISGTGTIHLHPGSFDGIFYCRDIAPDSQFTTV